MIRHRSLLLCHEKSRVTIRARAVTLIQSLRQPHIQYRIALLLALLLLRRQAH